MRSTVCPATSRFPGELRLPGIACIVHTKVCIERSGKPHSETCHSISSAILNAERAGLAVRGHWAIKNRWHWVPDVTFDDD